MAIRDLTRRLVSTVFISMVAACSVPTPPPAFTGRGTCGECHPRELAAFTGSHHDRAMEVPGPASVRGDFADAKLLSADLTSRFSQRDGRYWIRTSSAKGPAAELPVAYTFGVYPLQQYLVSAPGGRFQAFGAAWDARPAASGGQRWIDLSLHGSAIDQTWNHQCAECHSTDLRKGYDAATRTYRTTWSEVDVSCEACHGAGSRHVSWARGSRDRPDPTKGIALRGQGAGSWHWDVVAGKPVRAGAPPAIPDTQACGRCHSRRAPLTEDYLPGQHLLATHRPALLTEGLYYPDGQMQDEVFEYGSFLQSRMAVAGVACSDCHEPHSLRLRAQSNALCSQCHLSARYDKPTHTHHAAGTPAGECVSCHMPTRTYMAVDSRRDHGFRIPRPDLSVRLGTPDACTACHTNQSAAWAAAAVTRWFGERSHPTHYGEIFAAARSGDPDSTPALQALVRDRRQSSIVRATALVELARFPGSALAASEASAAADGEPLVRFAAAMVLEALPLQARLPTGTALLHDELLGVRAEAAQHLAGVPTQLLAATDVTALRRGLSEYESTLRLAADRPEAQLNLGNLAADLGKAGSAEAAYREAITLDATFIPAYVNLSDAQHSRGAEVDALATLRAGLARSPDDPGLRHAMGLALVRQGDRVGAIAELERAARTMPESARYAYVLAVAMHDAGRNDEALAALAAARARHPNDADILQAPAAFSRRD